MRVVAACSYEATVWEFNLTLPGVPRVGEHVDLTFTEGFDPERFVVDDVVWRDERPPWIGLRHEAGEHEELDIGPCMCELGACPRGVTWGPPDDAVCAECRAGACPHEAKP